MSVSSEVAFYRRNNLVVFAFVCVFVISFGSVSISLIVWRQRTEEDYFGKKNVLFIVIDDLRPALGCYDNRTVTPNIDQLASKSLLFKHAYAQQALGNPSRTSILTSRRPNSLHIWDDETYWRDTRARNFITLPAHFKRHGYETISIGKLFEHEVAADDNDIWTEFPFHPYSEENEKICPTNEGSYNNLICPVDVSNLGEGSLPDVEVTKYAIEYLKNKTRGNNTSGPFFLAVGYYKPHIPFKFPKEYIDLYPIDSLDIEESTFDPKLLKISWNPWMDIREKDDVKKLNVDFPYGPLPSSFQLLIRQAYYASVSYIDDQVGKLLQALEDTGYADHTTIVLLGDNGWSLGEHQEWSKYSNYEVSIHVPLIITIPELMENKPRIPFRYENVLKYAKKLNQSSEPNKLFYAPKYVTNELVELVDVYPTLTTIVDIPKPPLCRLFSTSFCTEGTSFSKLINQTVHPDPLVKDFRWKTAVFSQYPRPSILPQENSDKPVLRDVEYMGYSIRTERFRYTEWVDFNNTSFESNQNILYFRELYDHKYDPAEVKNVQGEEDYHFIVEMLSKMIEKDWHHAMPPGMFDSPIKNN